MNGNAAPPGHVHHGSGQEWTGVDGGGLDRLSWLVAILAVLVSGYRLWAAEEMAVSPAAGQGPIVLFNGTNLHGFTTWLVDARTNDPRAVFGVTNGWLRISGDGLGYLSTDRAYRDYRLVIEYRWGERNWAWGDRAGKARDSGVFLHSFGPEGNSHDGRGAFKAAIECNVFQGATGDFLLIRGTDTDGRLLAPRITVEAGESEDADGWPTWLPGGRPRALERWGRVNWRGKSASWEDRTDFRGPDDAESLPGEWTRLECVCDGKRITVIVNGRVVNQATDVFPSQGKILLQCEGSEIFFRKVELHPLSLAPYP